MLNAGDFSTTAWEILAYSVGNKVGGNVNLLVLGWPQILFFFKMLWKNTNKLWGDWVQSLSREDPLEKEMMTHSSILA